MCNSGGQTKAECTFNRITPNNTTLAVVTWREAGVACTSAPKNGWRCYQPKQLSGAIEKQVQELKLTIARLQVDIKDSINADKLRTARSSTSNRPFKWQKIIAEHPRVMCSVQTLIACSK